MLFKSFLSNWNYAAGPVERSNVDDAVNVFRDVLGIDLYPVQVEAAIALTAGRIVEVQTGEGKTFITGLAAALLSRREMGVHVATTNEYLSRRDFEQLRAVFRCLGNSVACLRSDQSAEQKRAAYQCDITYGAGSEFGFDYLRDQVKLTSQTRTPTGQRFMDALHGFPPEACVPVQSRRGVAIVDEADSVMIDEAGTPLVLGSATNLSIADEAALKVADNIAQRLRNGTDFHLVESRCVLAKSAVAIMRNALDQVDTKSLRRPWKQYVTQAALARHRYIRDVDYVVSDDKIAIIDSHTGRIHAERNWRGGLHQAIEMKEGLPLTDQSPTAAQITRQRFLKQYDLLCGLTGTATGNEQDFKRFFDLRIQVFPTHQPCIRRTHPARYFASREQKERHACREAIEVATGGRAVLVATRSVDEANRIGNMIRTEFPAVCVLHGMQDEDEAELVAMAGQAFRITVTTSIAGRGTDIKVASSVLEKGGMHLISTQHYDSLRVDRQLAGRVARQGEPGSVQQLASPEDTIFQTHSSTMPLARRISAKLFRITKDRAVCLPSMDTAIKRLQQQLESRGHARRLQLVSRDCWISKIQNEVA
ncbi:preprotein translocase subunit SecA [Aporhodopirellula aestuarii]|uniref:Protein translocase subunit SecA n=1 Tax=Aporhodopirellula aestuarii TaxID=2950107 RepID=A0ABT0TZK5_9BACT|nr:helicase-related protein [Aporhodopirellula aestuarii]MCM2369995.1 hypothetical protein [Aporhodopirellula aestuarii]